MAFEESLFNIYDPRLKPRLLHSIIMAHLRDEKQLPRSPAQLSVAVASIRRHHLLSETPLSVTTAPNMSGDPRKGAVDAWIDHLMGLLCSPVVCILLHMMSDARVFSYKIFLPCTSKTK